MDAPQSISPVTEAMVEAGAKAAAEAAEFCWDNCAQDQWRRDMRAGLAAALAVQPSSAGTIRPGRDEIAMLIDPCAFEDAMLQDDLTPSERMYFSQNRETEKLNALAKADAVLALIPNVAQAVPEPTEEMINAAAREMWNDRDARHGGSWDSRDAQEICVIQTKATAKAALKAALSVSSTDLGTASTTAGEVTIKEAALTIAIPSTEGGPQ